jgi:tetratricopeptide (TPR) repeat protein
MPNLLHKILRIEIVCAALLVALIVYSAPLFFRQSRSSAEAQTLAERHSRLRAALDRNDQTASEALLREMLDTDPDAFARNNYDCLLARLLQNRGARDDAWPFFLRVANRNSPLAGYAFWHLAEIARARGSSAEEQNLLRKLISQYADHLLRERATGRLSDSYFKTGQYQNAIDALRSLPRSRREVQAKIGEAQLALPYGRRRPQGRRSSPCSRTVRWTTRRFAPAKALIGLTRGRGTN